MGTLDEWYHRNPDFAFFCGTTRGMCAAIPLNRTGWEALVAGAVAESELDSTHLFDIDRDDEIGIHIYHVERSIDSQPGFAEHALERLNLICIALRQTNPRLTVCGLSGYCVTPQGIGLFRDRWSCAETRFVSAEHIMRRGSQTYVFELGSDAEIQAKTDAGYELVNRCRMLATAPGEPSIVWDFLG